MTMTILGLQNIDAKMLKTDEQIVLAAMKVFSKYPLEVATLRMIAQEGDVTLSLITYHFKTKENLYHEVLNRALSYITKSVRAEFAELSHQETMTREMGQESLIKLIMAIGDRLYANPHANLFGQIILREHFSPSSVYDTLYAKYFKKVIDSLTHLILLSTDVDDRHKASLHAFSILGQLISMLFERELMTRYFGISEISVQDMREVKAHVTENICRQLGIEHQLNVVKQQTS